MADTQTTEHVHSIRDQGEARKFINRRSYEYRHVNALASWILDTLEGGDQYKKAIYNVDWPYGDIQNLSRHRREMFLDEGDLANPPDYWKTLFAIPGAAPDVQKLARYNEAARMSYEFRLQRTPTPTHLRRVMDKHISRIYTQTPRREIEGLPSADDDAGVEKEPSTPEAERLSAVAAWWDDVDGRGTSINEWMRETVAPLLISIGMVDLFFDHPTIDTDAGAISIQSEADVIAARLRSCHAQVILPQNVLWYQLDYTEKYYTEVLIRELEYEPQQTGRDRECSYYRHWTSVGWTLYDFDGNIKDEGIHKFGRVPIIRAIDRRHPRISHAGDPRFLGIVEKCREYFNVESELIYAMDLQCFSMLQAPPVEFSEAGDAIPVGMGMVLYMVKDPDGGAPLGYSYVAPDTAPLALVMERLNHLADEIDLEAGLNRPSSATQKGGKTYPASGISKAFDQEEGNNILAGIAMALEAAEYLSVEMAATVLLDGAVQSSDLKAVRIGYTKQFNLLRYDELIALATEFVNFRDNCGLIPSSEKRILRLMVDFMIRDADPDERKVLYKDVDVYVDRAVEDKKNAKLNPPAVPVAPLVPPKNTTVPIETNPN